MRTKDLPKDERPYEKCEHYGSSRLSEAELLAVIIKTGTKDKRSTELAAELLSMAMERGGLASLYDFSLSELKRVSGIGRVKALQIQCALEFARRVHKASCPLKGSMTTPGDIAHHYMEDMRHYRQEHLILLMLNTKNKKIADVTLSKGSINAALISPREIFREAMRYDAVNIVLIHNHPSGDPSPSSDDISVTKTVAHLGQMLGIRLMDHIIIGDKSYCSLYESGFFSNADA